LLRVTSFSSSAFKARPCAVDPFPPLPSVDQDVSDGWTPVRRRDPPDGEDAPKANCGHRTPRRHLLGENHPEPRARVRPVRLKLLTAFDRAARIGDGFLFSGRTQTEAIQIKARIEAKLVELGRDRDAFGFESIQQYSRGDNQWPGDIAAWREAGGSHISVVTMGANLTTVDGHIKAIQRWRDVYNSVR
jgi:hypothetical protein